MFAIKKLAIFQYNDIVGKQMFNYQQMISVMPEESLK